PCAKFCSCGGGSFGPRTPVAGNLPAGASWDRISDDETNKIAPAGRCRSEVWDGAARVRSAESFLPSTMSKSLANFTNPALILPALHGENAAAVVEELSGTLHRVARVPDLQSFYGAVMKRESLVSTETEAGIALPHARI